MRAADSGPGDCDDMELSLRPQGGSTGQFQLEPLAPPHRHTVANESRGRCNKCDVTLLVGGGGGRTHPSLSGMRGGGARWLPDDVTPPNCVSLQQIENRKEKWREQFFLL